MNFIRECAQCGCELVSGQDQPLCLCNQCLEDLKTQAWLLVSSLDEFKDSTYYPCHQCPSTSCGYHNLADCKSWRAFVSSDPKILSRAETYKLLHEKGIQI